jgi:prepilin-type N-terminal cleavage/methylation domain-containing protein
MKSAAGFTLIELIMVILVIGILAVVAAPRFFGHGLELSGAAKKIAMDIRYCQELNMIRQGEDWRLGFAADHYFLWRDDNHNGSKSAAEPYAVDPVGQVDYQVYLNSMHLDSLNLSPAGISSIGFSDQGKPQYSGSDGDYSGINFILIKGSEQVTLHLESITGNVI